MSKCQESYLRAGQILFIDVPKRIELLESREAALRVDRTRLSQRPADDLVPRVTSFEYQSSISNSQLNKRPRVKL